VLSVRDLSYKYPGGTKALRDVGFDVGGGDIFAILGESGSGKTTLLRCIGRFLRPRRGTIQLDGRSVWDYKEREFRQRLGIVFQELNLFPHLTILQNMTLAPVRVLGQDGADAEKAAREMLERLRVVEISGRYPNQVSGGQAQRAAIARALMLKPECLLLDEPTSALDLGTTEEFAAWLLDLKEYTTFVVVTHDVPFAARVASSGVLLEGGAVVFTGPVAEVEERIRAGANHGG
jgi:polar amino acid transport system ATP-binding protein